MTPREDQVKQGNEAAAFRKALHKQCIAAREAMPTDEHARKSAALVQHLEHLLAQHAPGMLAFYWPIRAEVDCRSLVKRLLANGWRACLPVIVDRNSAMAFREWTPDSAMVAGEYGIPTVREGEAVTPKVLLMPVNAIDRAGYRLGYGGGYFDRTLAAMSPCPYTIGVGFDLVKVESISSEAHDCAVDTLVTESGVTCFGKRCQDNGASR